MPLPVVTAPPVGRAAKTSPLWLPLPSGPRLSVSGPPSRTAWALAKLNARSTNMKTNANLTLLKGDVIVETSFCRELLTPVGRNEQRKPDKRYVVTKPVKHASWLIGRISRPAARPIQGRTASYLLKRMPKE